jgi:hypothetical protein
MASSTSANLPDEPLLGGGAIGPGRPGGPHPGPAPAPAAEPAAERLGPVAGVGVGNMSQRGMRATAEEWGERASRLCSDPLWSSSHKTDLL